MIVIIAKKQNDLEQEVRILARIKKELKKDLVVQEIIQSAGKDLSIIDGLPIDFSDEIDVSAKTINSRILLNKALLSEPFEILMRYVIHELVHAFQHMDASNLTDDPYADQEYLDRPDEMEAFQYQIKFDSNHRGEDEVVEYVEELLDYHDIPENQSTTSGLFL